MPTLQRRIEHTAVIEGERTRQLRAGWDNGLATAARREALRPVLEPLWAARVGGPLPAWNRMSKEDALRFVDYRPPAAAGPAQAADPGDDEDWLDDLIAGITLEERAIRMAASVRALEREPERPLAAGMRLRRAAAAHGAASADYYADIPQRLSSDPLGLLHELLPHMQRELTQRLVAGPVRVQVSLHVRYSKRTGGDVALDTTTMDGLLTALTETATERRAREEAADQAAGMPPRLHEQWHNSKSAVVMRAADARAALSAASADVLEKIETFVRNGSDWRVADCLDASMSFYEYAPLAAGTHIPLPSDVAVKGCCVNPKNTSDNMCFMWAVLAAMHPQNKNAQRIIKYRPYVASLDTSMCAWPMPLEEQRFAAFEQANGVRINVFEWVVGRVRKEQRGSLVPLRVCQDFSEGARARPDVDLLWLSDGELSHYAWIKSINGMLREYSGNPAFLCRRCLHVASSAAVLSRHLEDCVGVNAAAQRTSMPSGDERLLRFGLKQFSLMMPKPFAVYADFESILPRADAAQRGGTTTLSTHDACAYKWVCLDKSGAVFREQFYRGPDAVAHFWRTIQELEAAVLAVIRSPVAAVHTPEWDAAFVAAEDCHICNKPLTKHDEAIGEYEDKIWEHDHIDGSFRGAAHAECNLQWQLCAKGRRKFRIPVFFHNSRSYDTHLLMTKIGGETHDKKISAICNNAEKYVVFQIGQLQFLDSCQFLVSSLDKLVESLRGKNVDDIAVLRARFPRTAALVQRLRAERPDIAALAPEDTHLLLLLRKGCMPYEWMDSHERFAETSLPPHEAFYSALSRTNVSDVAYAHAHAVWRAFGCRTFGEYHDIYLHTDVTLLADVFEDFRRLTLKVWRLDAANFVTGPSLFWAAMLRETRVELELLTDPEMELMCRRAVRGGVCQVSQRFVRANNPGVPGYNPAKEATHLLYVDANALYTHAMMQPLPHRGYRWGDMAQWGDVAAALKRLETMPPTGERGAILEVDLRYPQHLHNAHNELPLAPEHAAVQMEWLSPTQKAMGPDEQSLKQPKLLLTLRDKERYVLDFRALKYYLSQGLELVRVHRVIEYEQSAWMSPFHSGNTARRAAATSDFERALWKLASNSVFGKGAEDPRKRANIEIVKAAQHDQERRIRRLRASANYIGEKAVADDLLAVRTVKRVIKLDKPVQVGVAVLDVSKVHMYGFYYGVARQAWPRCTYAYGDTDSLFLCIPTMDVFADMEEKTVVHADPLSGEAPAEKPLLSFFDTAKYPDGHPLRRPASGGVPGLFKDELNGVPLREIACVRPKCYSFLPPPDGKSGRASKGTPRGTVEYEQEHTDYVRCIQRNETAYADVVSIRSHAHRMGTEVQRRKVFNPLDTKRWMRADGVSSFAYGHYAANE